MSWTGRYLETLADVAYIAGAQRYYTGDSRADVGQMIAWADEFSSLFTQQQDDNFEYLEAINDFMEKKLAGCG